MTAPDPYAGMGAAVDDAGEEWAGVSAESGALAHVGAGGRSGPPTKSRWYLCNGCHCPTGSERRVRIDPMTWLYALMLELFGTPNGAVPPVRHAP